MPKRNTQEAFSPVIRFIPKQSTRLVKCLCPQCGYLVRVTRKWLDLAGPPVCPTDRIAMTAV